MRVLVVDDEIYIRKGIINAVSWKQLGLELAGEAEDGYEALDMIKKLSPDIIIMDMKMPGMDGVGLIHSLKKSHPEISFIVISAYSDFEFTREAIVNKAFDYILKPVKKDELNAVLERCISDLKKQKALNGAAKAENNDINSPEAVLKRLIFEAPSTEAELEKNTIIISRALSSSKGLCCVCKIDNLYHATKHLSEADPLDAMKSNVVKALMSTSARHIVFISKSEQEVVAAVSLDKPDKDFFSALARNIKAFCSFTISIGIGGTAEKPSDLISSYKQAVKAVKMKRLGDNSAVIDFKSLPEETSNDINLSASSMNLFLNTLKSGDENKSIELFNKILSDLYNMKFSIYSLQKNMIILLGDIEKLLNASGTSIDSECGKSSFTYVSSIMVAFSSDEMQEIFRPLITSLSIFFSRKNKKGGKKIVCEIVQSMNDEYFKQISLYGYAKQYFLNPDYLGRIFKQETGKSFIDFLTELRIKKAMELIEKNTFAYYYEVAENVGYDDYSYFCKVFKMVTGLTPGEYADLTAGRNNGI